MCSRFAFFNTTEDIERLFKVRIASEWTPSYNIAPSQSIPVIIGNEFTTKKWGINLGFTKIINARDETLGKFKAEECIVLANGFFEWKNKQPQYFTSDKILQLKGIYKDNEAVIVTKEANDIIKPFHDRMPVILNRVKLSNYPVTKKMSSYRYNNIDAIRKISGTLDV